MPLSSIVGHSQLVSLLRHAVALGRVPQSLLLAGPEGVGKHTVAIALAQAVNCPVRGEADDACGRCATCERIARGGHFDVVDVDAGGAASIKIETLRDRVLDVVGYRPFEARRRVFIIDPADALTTQAQDSLLKTLEEPPSGSMLMLITAFPDALLPTVQSRCRRLRFGPLSDSDVARVLVHAKRMDPLQARAFAAVAGGSITRALAEGDGAFSDDRDAALALVNAASSSRGGVTGRLKAAAALTQHGSKRRDREALATRIALVSTLLRDIAALSSGESSAVVNADVVEALERCRPAFTPSRLIAAWAALDHAQHALDRNGSAKIVADWVAVTL